MAKLDARQTGDKEVRGSTPAGLAAFFHEIFSNIILSIPLIQGHTRAVVSFRRKNVHTTG